MKLTLTSGRRAALSPFPGACRSRAHWPASDPQARADVVTDWNAVVTGPVVAPRFGGPQQHIAGAVAMVQIAVHDASIQIHRRYETYDVVPTANASAEPGCRRCRRGAAGCVSDARAAAGIPRESARSPRWSRIPCDARTDAVQQQQTAGHRGRSGRGQRHPCAPAHDGSATPSTPYLLLPGPVSTSRRPTPSRRGRACLRALQNYMLRHTPEQLPGLGPVKSSAWPRARVQRGQTRRQCASAWHPATIQRAHRPLLGGAAVPTRRDRADRRQRTRPRPLAARAALPAEHRHGRCVHYHHGRQVHLQLLGVPSMHDHNPDTVPDFGGRPFLRRLPALSVRVADGRRREQRCGPRDYFGTDAIAFDQNFPILPLPVPLRGG